LHKLWIHFYSLNTNCHWLNQTIELNEQRKTKSTRTIIYKGFLCGIPVICFYIFFLLCCNIINGITHHEIAKILLKLALNTITYKWYDSYQTDFQDCIVNLIIWCLSKFNVGFLCGIPVICFHNIQNIIHIIYKTIICNLYVQ
jgi:hypothetical protein